MAAEICLLGTFRGALAATDPVASWGLLETGLQKRGRSWLPLNPCSGLTVGNG